MIHDNLAQEDGYWLAHENLGRGVYRFETGDFQICRGDDQRLLQHGVIGHVGIRIRAVHLDTVGDGGGTAGIVHHIRTHLNRDLKDLRLTRFQFAQTADQGAWSGPATAIGRSIRVIGNLWGQSIQYRHVGGRVGPVVGDLDGVHELFSSDDRIGHVPLGDHKIGTQGRHSSQRVALITTQR